MDPIKVTVSVDGRELTRDYIGDDIADVTMWGERMVDMLNALEQAKLESFNDHKHD